MLTIKLTWVLFRLTRLLFRLTRLLFRLTQVFFRPICVLFRLTRVLFRFTRVLFKLTGNSPHVTKCPRALSSIPSSVYLWSWGVPLGEVWRRGAWGEGVGLTAFYVVYAEDLSLAWICLVYWHMIVVFGVKWRVKTSTVQMNRFCPKISRIFLLI